MPESRWKRGQTWQETKTPRTRNVLAVPWDGLSSTIRKIVVVAGQERALEIAVQTLKSKQRKTTLSGRIQDAYNAMSSNFEDSQEPDFGPRN